MSLHKGHELVSISPHAVVPLIADISTRFLEGSDPDAEGAVSLLPSKLRPGGKRLVDPYRRFAFENLDRLGDRHRRRQAKKEMDVIVSPAAGDHFEIASARDLIEVWPEAFANPWR